MNKKTNYEKDFWDEKRNNLSSMFFLPKSKKLLDFIYTKAGMLRSKDQSKWIIDKYSPKKILEIGFGYGGGLVFWNKEGYNINGIEPDLKMAERINKIVGKKIAYPLKFEKLDKKNKYDLVILSHVFEHLDNIDDFFKKLKEIQPEKGYLFLEVPNCQNKIVLVESKENVHHLHHFTMETLTKVIKDHGYSIIKKETLISKIDHIIRGKSIFSRSSKMIKVLLSRKKSVPEKSSNADCIRILAIRNN